MNRRRTHRRSVLALLAAVLCGASAVGAAKLEIDEGAAIHPGVFGANQNYARGDNPADSAAHRALVDALNITRVRYPGGSPASFWDWRTGRFIPEGEITAIWPRERGNWMLHMNRAVNALPEGTLGAVRFADFAEVAGVEVQWTLNLTTREKTQAEMFERLKREDVPVRFVEMDNEAYFWSAELGGRDGGRVYAERVAALSPKIRELFPEAKIGVVLWHAELFRPGEESRSATQRHWNDALAAKDFRRHFDAVILHHYMKVGALDAWESDTDRGKAFLAYPQASLRRAAGIVKEKFQAAPIWITEYNVIAYNQKAKSPSDRWLSATKNTPWNALYQAGFWLTAMEQPESIGLLNHHSIANVRIGWGLAKPVNPTEADLTPTGQLFAHLSHLASEHETMHPVRIAKNPELGLAVAGEERLGALQAVALRREGRTTLLVLNRSEEDVPIEPTDTSGYKRLRVTTYRAEAPAEQAARVRLDADRSIWQQGPMKPQTRQHDLQDGDEPEISAPAFSLSIIELLPSTN